LWPAAGLLLGAGWSPKEFIQLVNGRTQVVFAGVAGQWLWFQVQINALQVRATMRTCVRATRASRLATTWLPWAIPIIEAATASP
jgi:hypothetical protein